MLGLTKSLSPSFSLFLPTLTLCACPVPVSEADYSENKIIQEKSDNVFFIKQSKCIDGSNFFPDGGRGSLNADSNRWCEGKVHITSSNVTVTEGNDVKLKLVIQSHMPLLLYNLQL